MCYNVNKILGWFCCPCLFFAFLWATELKEHDISCFRIDTGTTSALPTEPGKSVSPLSLSLLICKMEKMSPTSHITGKVQLCSKGYWVVKDIRW
jgi:hypothetical protein